MQDKQRQTKTFHLIEISYKQNLQSLLLHSSFMSAFMLSHNLISHYPSDPLNRITAKAKTSQAQSHPNIRPQTYRFSLDGGWNLKPFVYPFWSMVFRTLQKKKWVPKADVEVNESKVLWIQGKRQGCHRYFLGHLDDSVCGTCAELTFEHWPFQFREHANLRNVPETGSTWLQAMSA